MIEWFDDAPHTNVRPAEYTRLLGFPPGRELDGRVRELADWARAWYAEHGRPWVYARQMPQLAVTGEAIRIGDAPFTSTRLGETLTNAGAESVVLVAASAGPELEQAAAEAWRDEKPDEYFFLEMYGSAVVEHLTTMAGARLCAWADGESLAVLPHYSPGYPEWDMADQPRLLRLITGAMPHAGPLAIEVLDSGMLRPKKSLLAVFGLTPHLDRVRRLTSLIPCQSCSFTPCQYRRTVPSPEYTVNAAALRRWAAERLSLSVADDGTVEALFRYDGTTCSNMGRPLTFHYQVTLGPRDQGYPIRAQRCAPAPGDTGHASMCRYLSDAGSLMTAIDTEKPLQGRPLADVLSWQRPTMGPGCYCEADARQHKWGLVLETIHYALKS